MINTNPLPTQKQNVLKINKKAKISYKSKFSGKNRQKLNTIRKIRYKFDKKRLCVKPAREDEQTRLKEIIIY